MSWPAYHFVGRQRKHLALLPGSNLRTYMARAQKDKKVGYDWVGDFDFKGSRVIRMVG